MKLDPKQIRYLTPEDWRVLAAVEQGSRNHLVVPTALIISLTNARGGSQISKSISTLAKSNLIAKVKNASYDGYRLTYGGLDYLALHAHLKSGTIYSIGNQIGVGKESDIYVVASPGGRRLVLKIHRLGRTSFRTVKNNREYLRKGGSGSWMYMSTLAARKEWTFMRALRESGFAVPEPVGWNRHTVVMELIDAFPLRQISTVPHPAELYERLIDLILSLARYGLIHADFNEFNLLAEETEKSPPSSGAQEDQLPHLVLKPVLIDFPQTLSISHPNAEYYFSRDVQCIKTFFERRFHFVSDEPGPFFADALKNVGQGEGVRRLDIEVEASGFSKKMAKELEKYMQEHGVDGDTAGDSHEDELDEADDRDAVGTGEEEQNDLVERDKLSAGAGAGAGEGDWSVKEPPKDSQLIEDMTVLQLEDAPATAALPIPPKMAGDTISLAGPATANKQRVTKAKAANGWAI
jgi:RIO kinase 2